LSQLRCLFLHGRRKRFGLLSSRRLGAINLLEHLVRLEKVGCSLLKAARCDCSIAALHQKPRTLALILVAALPMRSSLLATNAQALISQIFLLPPTTPLTGDHRRLHIALNTACLRIRRLLLRARI
jgi:hypothetical protein